MKRSCVLFVMLLISTPSFAKHYVEDTGHAYVCQGQCDVPVGTKSLACREMAAYGFQAYSTQRICKQLNDSGGGIYVDAKAQEIVENCGCPTGMVNIGGAAVFSRYEMTEGQPTNVDKWYGYKCNATISCVCADGYYGKTLSLQAATETTCIKCPCWNKSNSSLCGTTTAPTEAKDVLKSECKITLIPGSQYEDVTGTFRLLGSKSVSCPAKLN